MYLDIKTKSFFLKSITADSNLKVSFQIISNISFFLNYGQKHIKVK